MVRLGPLPAALALALVLALSANGGMPQAPRPDVAEHASPVPVQTLRCGPPEASATLQVQGGSARDHVLACDALTRVRSFFAAHGRATRQRVVVEFHDTVMWEWPAAPGARQALPRGGATSTTERVVGLFDPGRDTVQMTSEASPWLRGYACFGLAMSDELITTMLAHEISHALSRSLYAPPLQSPDTDLRVQQECIAYVVQLATMDPLLRTAALAGYPAAVDPDAEGAINALALALSPEVFGVRCYRHFSNASHGGRAFLDRLYSGAFQPWVAY